MMMSNRRWAWRVWDPQIGISLWWTERDARQVARHRQAVCRVERVGVGPGDLVSRLGAPDERIPEPGERRRRCAVCGGWRDVGMHLRCDSSGYEGL